MKIRPYYLIARNSFFSEIEYRTSFVVALFSNIVIFVMDLAVLKHLLVGRQELGGLTADRLFTFLFVGTVLRVAQQMWSPVYESIDTIRDGSFRRFLLQPIAFPAFFMAKSLGTKLGYLVLSAAVALVLFVFFKGTIQLAPHSFWPLLILSLLSVALAWLIYLTIVYLGFWVEESTFMMTAFNICMSILSGSMLPLELFPSWVQSLIHLTPLPLLGAYPIKAALGTLPASELQWALIKGFVWIVGLVILIRTLQIKAYRRYEAFGA
jgi:ABC-2 type transport system permease protein